MTSSSRHLQPGQSKWNYQIQKYKDLKDPFCEPGLISIVFLACGRPDITQKCLESTLECAKLYSGEIEWIFIENGNCEENYQLFKSLQLERKVIVRQDNAGINEGLNQGWALSRGEYVVILENDWFTPLVDFFQHLKDILDENQEIGIVQLRDPWDPNENFGFQKALFNPWSCTVDQLSKENIKLMFGKTKRGHNFYSTIIPNGFNNNPICIRKSLYRQCGPYPEAQVGADPAHGETLYAGLVAQTKTFTAHISLCLYRHFGQVKTKGV